MSEAQWTEIAALDLSTARAQVRAFAAALGAPEEPVPATFAFTVFSHPSVMETLARLAGERSAVLVHQAQDFVYSGELEADRHYTVLVDWKSHEERADRLTLRGRVQDLQGTAGGTPLQEFRAEIVLFENRESAP
ncbi:hypothetical protein [Stappia sp. WLB 29]|uniref:hypothetical protein n=1 Tax=Stappia sp. WLB 29 TaxID=2925220 RepID=UPI0020C16282|nr:hypothetical protein [Stappia sp. WLB 29]